MSGVTAAGTITVVAIDQLGAGLRRHSTMTRWLNGSEWILERHESSSSPTASTPTWYFVAAKTGRLGRDVDVRG